MKVILVPISIKSIAGGIVTPGLEDITKKSFLGIGFDSVGIPIDILPIYLLNSFLEDFSLLIVDEFLKMNGKSEEQIQYGQEKLLETIRKLSLVYDFHQQILFCSQFMRTEEYSSSFREIKRRIKNTELESLVLETVPQNKKHLESARDYPLHELVCVKYLMERGFALKIGPKKEREYDQIMQKMNFKISFAYILDAYALATKNPDLVVHYIPASRGPHNGQRIFFEEDERKIKLKLQQSSDDALRYFCKVASVSGHVLGFNYLENDEIKSLHGHQLKRETIRLVFDNIIAPYKGVGHHDPL